MFIRMLSLILILTLISCTSTINRFDKSKCYFMIQPREVKNKTENEDFFVEIADGYFLDSTNKKHGWSYSFTYKHGNKEFKFIECDCIDTLTYSLSVSEKYRNFTVFYENYYEFIPFKDSMIIDVKYINPDTLFFKTDN